jgi:hypothetical protein
MLLAQNVKGGLDRCPGQAGPRVMMAPAQAGESRGTNVASRVGSQDETSMAMARSLASDLSGPSLKPFGGYPPS